MTLVPVEAEDVLVHPGDTLGRESHVGLVAILLQVTAQYLLYTRIGDCVYLDIGIKRLASGIVMVGGFLREVVDLYFLDVHVSPSVFLRLEILLYLSQVVALRQEFFHFLLQVLVGDAVGHQDSVFQSHGFQLPQVHQGKHRVLVHGLTHRPHVALHLWQLHFLAILVMFIVVGGLVDDSQILLKAHDNIAQRTLHVRGKCCPRLQEFLSHADVLGFASLIDCAVLITAKFPGEGDPVGLILRHGRLVVQQIHVVPGGAGYHDSVHGVVAMVYALLLESLLQLWRD